MLEQVCPQCPKDTSFAQMCDGAPSQLFFAKNCISSSTGNPLAGLIFSLILQPIALSIREDWPNLLNAWYLDDGTLAGQ